MTQAAVSRFPKSVRYELGSLFDRDEYISNPDNTEAGEDPTRVIRFKQGADGQEVSNSRFVTWQDGSVTLHIAYVYFVFLVPQ